MTLHRCRKYKSLKKRIKIFSCIKIKNFCTTKDVFKKVMTERGEDIYIMYNQKQIVYN